MTNFSEVITICLIQFEHRVHYIRGLSGALLQESMDKNILKTDKMQYLYLTVSWTQHDFSANI